jgi:hypothetical protein
MEGFSFDTPGREIEPSRPFPSISPACGKPWLTAPSLSVDPEIDRAGLVPSDRSGRTAGKGLDLRAQGAVVGVE